MTFNSMSSRSFREMLLTQSIMAIFSKKTEPQDMSHRASNTSSNATAVDSEPGDQPKEKPLKTTETRNSSIIQQVDGAGDSDTPPSPQSGELPRYNGKTNPFAGGVEGGVTYQSMKWWQAGMVMVAETISLGILSLPQALSQLGMIPGLILLILLGALATYSGYVIGQLKIAYPHVHSMEDAGEILFGRIGGAIFGFGQLLFIIFIMGSHILTFSIMMNVLTEHSTCTVIFMFVGTVLSFLLTIPRTLRHLSYYSIASFASIIGAVFITVAAVVIQKPGFVEDGAGHMISTARLWPAPGLSFHNAFLAVANMVFAYAGHVAFFSFISELKDPRDFPKALAFLQISDISMYITIALVVYYFGGNNVASPALNSASPLFRKIAYGVACPTIVIAGVVNGHVAVKQIYVRLFRNRSDDIMHQKSFKSIGLWIFIGAVSWIISWIIAEGVPVFNHLLGLSSALFASWFTFGLSGMFWCHLNLKRGRRWWSLQRKHKWNWKKSVLLMINLLNIVIAACICFIGLYATARSMRENSQKQKSFSCANNAPNVGKAH